MQNNSTITVETIVNAPIEKVWSAWTNPENIIQWNFASDDWHCPRAGNDLRPGGKFVYHMAAKDGSAAFDFEGTYSEVTLHERIAYIMGDDREVVITFLGEGPVTKVTETFDPENIHSHEMQRAGWQAILDNFKRHVESNTFIAHIDQDIVTICVPVASFPQGVQAAHEKLHSMVAKQPSRRFYGISFGTGPGKIKYMAAANELHTGEAEALGCETFTIRKGAYVSVQIVDFMKQIPTIGRTFEQLLQDPRVDQEQGYCLEEYIDDRVVNCMVKLVD